MDFQDAEAYRMLGLGHYANEQYPAALNAFQESLARDPGNADVYTKWEWLSRTWETTDQRSSISASHSSLIRNIGRPTAAWAHCWHNRSISQKPSLSSTPQSILRLTSLRFAKTSPMPTTARGTTTSPSPNTTSFSRPIPAGTADTIPSLALTWPRTNIWRRLRN